MKKLVLLFLAGALSMLFAQDVQIISQMNKDGKITPKTIEAEFKKAGFYISDNRDMNQPFMIQFKKTDFKVYNLFTLYHIDSVQKLAKEYPRIGLFSPMSMSIYTREGEDMIHVAFLSVETMSKITGIPADNKHLQHIGKLVKQTLEKALPKGKYETVRYDVSPTQKELITKMHIQLKNLDWNEDTDAVIEDFESNIEVQGFVQAGYTDINYDFKNMGDNTFDLFVSESICKLPVIYAVAKTRPEAGAFAPCSVMFYKKQSDNFLHVEYPNVYNWIASLTIQDQEAVKTLLKAQAQMEVILYKIKNEYESY